MQAYCVHACVCVHVCAYRSWVLLHLPFSEQLILRQSDICAWPLSTGRWKCRLLTPGVGQWGGVGEGQWGGVGGLELGRGSGVSDGYES